MLISIVGFSQKHWVFHSIRSAITASVEAAPDWYSKSDKLTISDKTITFDLSGTDFPIVWQITSFKTADDAIIYELTNDQDAKAYFGVFTHKDGSSTIIARLTGNNIVWFYVPRGNLYSY